MRARHAAAAVAIAGLVPALAALPASAGNGTPIDAGSANRLTVAVYGDSPYGTTPTDDAELQASPAFIRSIKLSAPDSPGPA